MKSLPKTSLALLLCATAASSQLGPATTLSVGPNPERAALADFDGDGHTDMAVAVDAPDRILVYPGAGDGSFGAAQAILTGPGTSPNSPVAVDVDGDDDLDLAVTFNNQNAVRLYINTAGSFSAGASIGTGSDPRDIVAAQLDGAGALDLVTQNRDGNSVSVLLSTGPGAYSSTTLGVGTDPRGISVADLDGDGDDDIAVSAHDDRRIDLLVNDGAGGFSAGGSLPLGIQLRPEGVVAGDLDGDGDDDIATAASGNGFNVVAVFLQGPTGFGAFSTTGTGGVDPSGIALADVDVDGDDDILVTNADSDTLASLANDGSGSFALSATSAVGTNPGPISVADLDGNGSDDVVVTNQDAGSVSLLLNTNSAALIVDLGQGLAGTTTPSLSVTGALTSGTEIVWSLENALPGSSASLVIGFSLLQAPFKGGTMVPSVDILVSGLPISPAGTLVLSATMPTVPSGFTFYTQEWIVDAGGPFGFSASNALQGTTP